MARVQSITLISTKMTGGQGAAGSNPVIPTNVYGPVREIEQARFLLQVTDTFLAELRREVTRPARLCSGQAPDAKPAGSTHGWTARRNARLTG